MQVALPLMLALQAAAPPAPQPQHDVRNWPFIRVDDYPARAARQRHQGVVVARVHFTVQGRVERVDILQSGGEWLDTAVRQAAMRRLRMGQHIGPGGNRHIDLPPVQFRLFDCEGRPVGAPIPDTPGAIHLDWRQCRRLYETTPPTQAVTDAG